MTKRDLADLSRSEVIKMHAPYDRHHKVSSFLKSHQNTHNSVKYEVIWKWHLVMLIHKGHWISLTWISGHKGNFDNVMTKFIINKRTDAWKNWCQFVFYNNKTPKLPNAAIKWREKTLQTYQKQIKEKWILFKMMRTLSIAFPAFWLATNM